MTPCVYNSIRIVRFLAVLLFTSAAKGQSLGNKQAIVSNIRVELDTERIKVLYDAVNIAAADSVYLQVESRNRGRLNALTVTGDVGKAVLPGKNRTIYWDYRLDKLTINDPIRVTVLVKQPVQPVQQVASGGGPANALISLLAPGVGDIFVQPNRKVGLRPLITGAYVTLVVYGLVQQSRSRQLYDLYASQLKQSDYTDANERHHQYLVATRTAAVLLVADVVYTFLKGRKNVKQQRAAAQRVVFSYTSTMPTVGVQIRF